MLDELIESEKLDLGCDNHASPISNDSWVNDLRRVVDQGLNSLFSEDHQTFLDKLPGLPGSFPASPASIHRDMAYTSFASSVRKSGLEGLGLEQFSQNDVETSTPTDEALRALHAIATVAPNLQVNVSTDSYSSISTHGAQAFMAITTDGIADEFAVKSEVAVNTAADDFHEYTDYLRFVESPSSSSKRPTPVSSSPSFRIPCRRPSPISSQCPPHPARSSSPQRDEYFARPTPRRQDSFVSFRRRSCLRSFLKFVGRRPFSSSSSGFVPTRSSTAFISPTIDAEAPTHRSSTAKARLSPLFAGKAASRSLSDSDFDDDAKDLDFGAYWLWIAYYNVLYAGYSI